MTIKTETAISPEDRIAQEILRQFNEWADNRIVDCDILKNEFLEGKEGMQDEIDTLNFAKRNLERIVKELLKGGSNERD